MAWVVLSVSGCTTLLSRTDVDTLSSAKKNSSVFRVTKEVEIASGDDTWWTVLNYEDRITIEKGPLGFAVNHVPGPIDAGYEIRSETLPYLAPLLDLSVSYVGRNAYSATEREVAGVLEKLKEKSPAVEKFEMEDQEKRAFLKKVREASLTFAENYLTFWDGDEIEYDRVYSTESKEYLPYIDDYIKVDRTAVVRRIGPNLLEIELQHRGPKGTWGDYVRVVRIRTDRHLNVRSLISTSSLIYLDDHNVPTKIDTAAVYHRLP